MGDLYDSAGFVCPKCGGNDGFWGNRDLGNRWAGNEYLICREDGEVMSLPGKDPSVRNNEGALEKVDRALPLLVAVFIIAMMVVGFIWLWNVI